MRLTGLVAMILWSVSINAQPQIRFNKKVQKYEKVKAGEVLSFYFLYENTGTEPLIISEIKVACNCTKFEFPSKPLLPNKSDTIKVSFDTNGKSGWQDRELNIYSNAKKSPETIRFKGMVDAKKRE